MFFLGKGEKKDRRTTIILSVNAWVDAKTDAKFTKVNGLCKGKDSCFCRLFSLLCLETGCLVPLKT